jgi:hypothetical protein
VWFITIFELSPKMILASVSSEISIPGEISHELSSDEAVSARVRCMQVLSNSNPIRTISFNHPKSSEGSEESENGPGTLHV